MATNQLDTDPRQPATAPNLAFDPDLGTYVRQESAAALDELDAEDREADRLADQWAGMDWRDKPIGPDTAIEILRGLPEVIEIGGAAIGLSRRQTGRIATSKLASVSRTVTASLSWSVPLAAAIVIAHWAKLLPPRLHAWLSALLRWYAFGFALAIVTVSTALAAVGPPLITFINANRNGRRALFFDPL